MSLPTEVWLKIFALACTDTGKTGRSLSEVSRYIRDVSAEYRYQSVAACTAREVYELRDRLLGLPVRLRRVRHLHLNRTQRSRWDVDLTQLSKSEMARRLPQLLDDQYGLSTDNIALDHRVQDILTWVAPTLETLSLVNFLPGSECSSVLTRIQYPHLTELTVRGFVDIPLSPRFAPNLERLNGSYEAITRELSHVLANIFPRLSHLRLSDTVTFDLSQMRIILELIVALGMYASSIPQHHSIARLPPNARRYLYIQPAISTYRQTVTNHQYLHWARSLAAEYPYIVVLPTRTGFDKAIERERELQDWLARIQREPGYWAAADRARTALRIPLLDPPGPNSVES